MGSVQPPWAAGEYNIPEELLKVTVFGPQAIVYQMTNDF